MTCRLSALLIALCAPAHLWAARQPLADPARAAQIAPLLPEKPSGPGSPITDRAAWSAFASTSTRDGIVRGAETLLKVPLPQTTDDLFLDFSKTGNRTRWQKVAGQRRGRLAKLVLAECIENKGRFLPALHELARSLCAERTWTMPAHDRKLDNFHGKAISIDLASSDVAWQFAVALHLLDDRIAPDVRGLIRSRIDAWVLNPARGAITGTIREQSWMRATHNWNAVCTAGTTGAALALIESREDRALFAAAAEASSAYFLSGFTPDGYCSEGLGYWNYGFGHFLLLAETLIQSTSGKVNLLDLPGALSPALFPNNIHIQKGVFPAFADCAVGSRPAKAYMYFINRYYQAGWPEYDSLDNAGATGGLSENLLLGFPNSASRKPSPRPKMDDGIRSWFKEAGILVARPKPESDCHLAVALKGGNNAEHHNHNDLGSYVVVLGREALILDPGGEVYTARTFSKDRYASKVLSSFGHPVPMVGGKLQRTGRDAQAKALETRFTDATDTLTIDITSAYETPGLKSLVRTFTYSREGPGRLVIRDDVILEKPSAFETALVTLDAWCQASPKTILISGSRAGLKAEMDTGGKAFDVIDEEIQEDVHTRNLPRRIAIRLTQPVTRATVTVTLSPLTRSQLGPQPANGDFEQGSVGWQLDDKMSAITNTAGNSALHILDNSKALGSSASSAPALLGEPGRHEIRGRYLNRSGKGIGIYVRFLDQEDRAIKTDHDARPVGVLGDGPPSQSWRPFAFAFHPPQGADAVMVWIHSISSAIVDGYIDDIQVVRAEPAPNPAPKPTATPLRRTGATKAP